MICWGDMAKKNIIEVDFLLILLLILLSPLFFYKLGQSSLISWDEAWYGEIARNILRTGDLFRLSWNGDPYTDHPPFGFWLIAISFKIFGISEFWARFPSAISGLISVLITYLIGKELFNKWVGIASAVALPSAFWFLYRARSGNLDIFLTLMFLLAFYFALKSLKKSVFFIPFFVSLTFLVLTKTLVPLTILPMLLILFSKINWKKINWTYFFIGFLFFISLISFWWLTEKNYKSDFVSRYFMIGLPGVKLDSNYLENLKLTKEYLHSGIGKWFWPGVLSIFLGLFLFQRRFLILSVFSISFLTPFIFSGKGHIWHLIPVYPFLLLSFFGIFSFLGEIFQRYFKIESLYPYLSKVVFTLGIIFISLFFSFQQLKRSFYEFINIPAFVSDEEILSTEASKIDMELYIDGSNFQPAAVFYSGKKVDQIWEGGLLPLFKDKKSFLLITHLWRLDKYNINPKSYKILKTDRDKILILKK